MAFGLMGPAMLVGLGRVVAPLSPARLRFHDGHRRVMGIAGGALGVLLLVGRLLSMPALEADAIGRYQPVGAASWLADHPQAGRLFSEYGWGGYLSYRLRVPVGPYGASDAFGDEVMAELDGVFNGSVDPGPYLDRNTVDTVVVPGDSVLGHYLAASDAWQELFRDGNAVVLGRVAPAT